jgi:leucine efflux protein
MFYGITDLTTFVLGTIFIVLLPGPNSLYVMSVASRWGIAAGYQGAMGVFAGDTVLMVLSVMGAASLLHTTPALFLVVKYAGAGYLAWMGLGLLRAGLAAWRLRRSPSAADEGTSEDPPAHKPFRTAFVISLMNPKAILFFVSFFIQFVDPGYDHPALSFLLLGAVVQLCSAAYLSLLIFAGARLAAQFRRYRRTSATATAGVGVLFVGFGAKLAGATLG